MPFLANNLITLVQIANNNKSTLLPYLILFILQ